jgi:acyl carrier protein
VPADEVLDRFTDVPPVANLDERLAQVFEATFPDLSPDAIPTASIETVEDWDSLQSVTLMTLLEEEFGIVILPFDLAELGSFDAARAYLLRSEGAS